jgi:hypothetical protein
MDLHGGDHRLCALLSRSLKSAPSPFRQKKGDISTFRISIEFGEAKIQLFELPALS